MSETPDVVTFITFGVLSIIACLLAMILPETGDEDLPDTGKLFKKPSKMIYSFDLGKHLSV